MAHGFGKHKGHASSIAASRPVVNLDPNPRNFKVMRVWQGKHAHALEINYPDCRNFEGNKTLVLPGQYDPSLTVRDPHFSTDPHAPLARFQPSSWGWNAAVHLAANYTP